MKKVLIVGAGGFGRELLAWCRRDPGHGDGWKVTGFLDDTRQVLQPPDMDIGIVGSISGYKPGAGEELLCALGLPGSKVSVVGMLRDRGATFRQYVDPSAVIGDRVRLGEGVVICPGAVLSADIELGDFVMVNYNSTIGHDVRVGAFSTVSGQCDLTGYSSIGREVFLGSGVRVLPQVKIGDGAKAGAGSVVIRDVAPGMAVTGNPARSLPVA